MRQGACGEVPGRYWELQCLLHSPIGLRRMMGFFTLQELTCFQMTCHKLRHEGEDKEGWLSLLWDKHTPVTLLLAELTPSSAAGPSPGKTAFALNSSSALDT